MNRASLVLAAVLLMPLACVDTPARTGSEGAKAEPSEPVAPVAAPKPAPDPAPTGSLELSAEELELIAADPKSLTPEQNRKRGYALRKKVMQNPESETAKALEDARAAALAGEVDLGGVGSQPESKDAGLVIDLPKHLEPKDATAN